MMRGRALTPRDITLGQEQSGVKGGHVWEVEKKKVRCVVGGGGGGGWGGRRKREEETKMGCTKHGLMRTR